jgi:hypothetical protein
MLPIHLERKVSARQLGVELLPELGGPCPQASAHPLALGLADFAKPAVLNRRQHGEQDEQDDSGGQLPGNTAHEDHSTRKASAGSPLFTFLTKRLRRDNNFRRGSSSYSSQAEDTGDTVLWRRRYEKRLTPR